ncbi:hypothetical protein DFQ28_011260 [Apophysomyces sp. BC1034]|nr:hypothetical protein DFQ28_011260 [Apophysomyces sp. BC1034]
MSSVYTTFASPDEDIFPPLISKRQGSLDIEALRNSDTKTERSHDNEDSSSEEFVDAVDNQVSELISENQQLQTSQKAQNTVRPTNNNSSTLDPDAVMLAADHLWAEDPHFCARESIAEWLGTSNTFRTAVLKQYMSRFDFSKQRVDAAFRKLCSKLYFKAEAQQMDRILEAFASRYWECNSNNVLGSEDIVYAVAYSVLLLNTDLHATKENHRKMTKSKFVKNTIATTCSLNSSSYAPDTYLNLNNTSHFSLSLPISESVRSALSSASTIHSSFRAIRRNPSAKSLSCIQHKKSSDTMKIGPTRSIDSLRSKNLADQSLARKQKAWLAEVETLLKEIYNCIKSNPIGQVTTDQEQSTTPIETQKKCSLPPSIDEIPADVSESRRDSESSSVGTSNILDRQHSLSTVCLPTTLDTKRVDVGINLHKEGFVMRKQVLETADRKAKNRGWQLCYMDIHEGELTMYRPANGSSKDRRRSLVLWSQNKISSIQDNIHSLPSVCNEDHNSDGAWKYDHQQVLGKIDTKHSLARLLPPPGWNGQRHHVFCLETADGAVWLFEALNLYSVLEWVSTCNYWAALKSKEPLLGGVCNLDYGWGTCWIKHGLQDDEVAVPPTDSPLPEWKPPMPCLVASILSENDQLQVLTKCADRLVYTLEEHRGLKDLIDRKYPPRTSNKIKAFVNWEQRTQYLLREIIKYRTYIDILHRSLQAKSKKSQSDQRLDDTST